MTICDLIQPLLSIIVPSYNSERTIKSCLNALQAQSTSISFEIVVVDSSSDRTPEIVSQEFPSVKLVRLEKRTFAGTARNIGALQTCSPHCLMIDSDCIAKSDLIERAMARAREGDYAVIGGSLRNGTPRSLSGWISYLIEFKEFIPAAPTRLVSSVPTANALYSRDALEKAGYFEGDMRLAEDLLLNWRIHSGGGRILFDPTIEVTHLNRTGWKKVFSYQVDLGRYSAIARRRGHLPGEILLRHPGVVLLMPFVRTLKAFNWLASCDRNALLVLLLLWPMYLIAACFWSYGFLQEAGREMFGQPTQQNNK